MDNQQSLVFSAVSGNSLTVRKSGADWIAYFQNTPNLVFLAPQIGMFSYLKLLYISKKTPFDRNLCDMNYFAGDNFGVGNKIACFGGPIETRCEVISIFEHIVMSGLSLLDCGAKMVDRKNFEQKSEISEKPMATDLESSESESWDEDNFHPSP